MAIPSPRANAQGQARDLAPLDWWESAEHRRKLAEIANQAIQGKTLNVSTVTLDVSSATTILMDTRIGISSFISLMPTTANAAAENWYITGRSNMTATINHANNTQADRTFVYVVIG